MSSKLRNALEKISTIADQWYFGVDTRSSEDLLVKCGEIADEALDEPCRNCDRFKGLKDAEEAYCKEVEKIVIWDGWHCERFIKWLFAEAEGGNNEQ